MRRLAACLSGLLAAAPAAEALAQSGAAPHAWLFGAWTGGLFPAAGGVAAQACLGQPTVIFTRDVVMRASLIEASYAQRLIVTARAKAASVDILFTPAVDALAATGNRLMGGDPPKPALGFGCETPDVLHVERRGDNEIAFPGCKEFPEPLVRCPAR